MTLSQIIAQALRQLGEDPQDVSEYEEAFKVYANMGYDIAVREYLKPRREMCLDIDGNGRAPVVGVIVNRVIRMTDEDGRDVAFDLAGDGRSLTVWRDDLKGKTLRALCEVSFPPMEDGEDDRCFRHTRTRHCRTTSVTGTYPAATSPSRAARSFLRTASIRR